MEDITLTIKQADGTEIQVSTELIQEDVIRMRMELKPHEQK